MIRAIIEASARYRWVVFGATAALLGWSMWSLRRTPLDAVPDLSDPQVIVFTEWMGRSPDLVEDQVTYPLVRALQSTPGVRTVRGYSMFGMSFLYAIFEDGTDIYWARTRVLEQLGRVQQLLPSGASPILGPDATGVGWIYQYVVVDESGELDLARLRELQDYTIRPELQAVSGVAEVASLGGFERQFQVVLDPDRLASFGLSPQDVMRAVRDANSEVGARVLEMSGREYVVRGRGYVRALEDIERSAVALGAGGTPIRVRDVAAVQYGPEIRRGAADWNGRGETVGGIVIMRIGSNALDVIEGVEQVIAELPLPDGVRLVPTYDRSDLIRGSVATLRRTLLEEGLIVALVCVLFLLHARSALVTIAVMPVAVALSFIPLHYLGLTTNIMSLGGIAIAIGALTDASIVLIENAHVRLAEASPGADRSRVIVDAVKEVGGPIFFSLLLITAAFMPIFLLPGQSGRLFRPLAYTKTFAMFWAAIASITLAPPLMVLLLRGKIRSAHDNPVARTIVRMYQPVARAVVRGRLVVVALALAVMAATVPVYLRLGSEFMPPLDEGSLLIMPATFPGISIEEARRVLTAQNRIVMSFPEVASVHGKAGRAETATDPAQLDMIESVVTLKPRDEWPPTDQGRPRTLDELARDMTRAVATPGFQIAIAPPIRTRIDMLTTGVRTPVGVKVLGPELGEIERISLELEGILRQVPGARSTFAERQTGREYVDVIPDRDAIARYGLTVRDVHDVIEAAVGGMVVSTVIDGRARFSMNVRYGIDWRADTDALKSVLVPVPASAAVAEPQAGESGAGSSGPAMTAAGGMGRRSGGGMGGMGGMGVRAPASMGMGGGVAAGASGMAASSSGAGGDVGEAFRPPGATVPLSELAQVVVTTGPPMIKDENGVLAGYVFADIDTGARDLGGWVADAKRRVDEALELPAGYRLQWTGQYEFLAETRDRLVLVLPLTVVIILILLYLSLRGLAQTLLVFTTLPFAAAGSIWLLAALGYNFSTAVWVGVIAVSGLAAEIGTVMVIYLDQAYRKRRAAGPLTPADVDAAVIEGASQRVRPVLMTVCVSVLSLLPLLWSTGVGADVTARTAAPVVGGLLSATLLTLLVLPAAYTLWRRAQLRRSGR